MHTFDFEALRQQFPLLAERNYLANHSLGTLPQQAFLDIKEYEQSLFQGRRALPAWLERHEEMHTLIGTLLNAPTGSVMLAPNVTTAQAAIAAVLTSSSRRNRIIITDLDFPSCRYLWTAQSRRGFHITEITASQGIEIKTEDVIAQLDERVAVVAVSLVSYLNSACLEIHSIIKAAHAVGAIVVLDAYQAVGLMPLDVTTLEADIVLGGMHKWLYGGVGLAFAYIHPSLSEKLEPIYPGWFGHLNPTAFEPAFKPALGARRFQQGTPSIEPIYASRAGIGLILEVGVEQIYQRSLTLTNYLIAGADAYNIPVNTPRTQGSRGGTVCLGVNNPTVIVQELAGLGIDVDTRSELGIRVSPHLCTTEKECQQLIERIAQLSSI